MLLPSANTGSKRVSHPPAPDTERAGSFYPPQKYGCRKLNITVDNSPPLCKYGAKMNTKSKAEAAPAQSGQHTSIPWHLGDPFVVSTPESFKGREFIGIGNGADHIGYVSITNCVRMAKAKANAEFILKTCNCHDELVAALRDAVKMICYVIDDGYQYEGAVELLSAARAAIAKAERRGE